MRIREFDKSYRVICLVAILGLIGFFYPAGAQEPPAPVKSAPVSEAQSEAEAENESDPEPEPLSTPAPATTPEAAPVSVPAPAPSPAVQQGPPVPKFEVLEKVYKEPVERNPHLKKTAGGVPLLIDGKEIFRIRASLGAYTAKVRVSSIEQRLKELIDDPDCATLIQQIKTEESGYSTNIVAGSHTLLP